MPSNTNTTEASNIAVVRGFFESFNRGDIAEARTYLADDVLYEGPRVPEIWWAKGRIEGADNIVKEMIDDIDQYFERLEVKIEDIYECGPWVVLIARHDGQTKGGRRFDSALVQIYTVRDGKAVRLCDYPDTNSWLEKVV
jgi:ketosteroid isomerase-like protein